MVSGSKPRGLEQSHPVADVAAGQIRQWWRGRRTGSDLFIVVEHCPMAMLGGRTDDGWMCLEDGTLEWYHTLDIKGFSDLVQG